MADVNTAGDQTGARKEEKLEQLRPTLFIGVGGTGMEVLLRVRRHILNALWGTAPNRLRVESLADFPVAQFINFDLDSGATTASDQSQKQDLLYDAVKFSDDERIAEPFDIDKYSRDDDSLARYPHIQAWSPLTPGRIRSLGIDPSKGAGQIRAISRLYFFDKYARIRDQIRIKLQNLKSGLTKDAQFKRLGLELAADRFRVVVIGSVAGGTGAGSFLDMGWLAGWIAQNTVMAAEVELVLFMPSGFQRNNKDRTEANGYAALMELETAMRGGNKQRYVTRWDEYENPALALRPYDDVYLVDAGNLSGLHTSDIKHVYEMVADALFENFASADFANKKRSVAVNQRQHKILPLVPPVARERYGDMKLSYYKGYSAFGQSVLDTQQEARRDIRAHLWAGEMLKAFFGVAGGEVGANRATDKQRDAFMAEFMLLSSVPFSDFPKFSSREVELKRSSGEFGDYLAVDELLKDRHGSLTAGVQQKVDDRMDAIKVGFKREDWSAQVRDLVKVLERDAIRDQDAVADTIEDRVGHRRQAMFGQLRDGVRDRLFAYLDNKEFGGLSYVLSLVELIKDRLANPSSGLITELQLNAARYLEIRDAVRTHEYERLLGNLEQTRRGGFFNNAERQAVVVIDQIKLEVANYIKFHLRYKAATEAARLMQDLSTWLGEREGVDVQGQPAWSGLVGELQHGRAAVIDMLDSLQRSTMALQQDLKHEHATYIFIETPEVEVALPPPQQLREWADDAFKDIGGSRVLFRMLGDSQARNTLLGKVRRMADRQMSLLTPEPDDAARGDPLLLALEGMSVGERHKRFSELLTRAMPWVDAKLNAEYTPSADQYRCFVGVSDAATFERLYRAEIDSCVPAAIGITSAQVAIVQTGVPGRAVCYCELSGIPLTVLRGLEPWRTSYRKESGNIPLHTHIDSTQFAHPLVPQPGELNQLADDFKSFLLAVMLGVLKRSTQRKLVPPGQYEFEVARGDILNVGNERAFRQNGLPIIYRDAIVGRVNDLLDDLEAEQMVCLAALASRYASDVYAPRLQADESGAEVPVKGFASAMATAIANDMTLRAGARGLAEDELERLYDRASRRIGDFTARLADSDADAYEWELRELLPGMAPRLKLIATRVFFDHQHVLALLAQRSATTVPPPVAGSVTPPGLGATPAEYWLNLAGVAAGPFMIDEVRSRLAQGQAQAGTLAWQPGLSAWTPLSQLPALAVLLARTTPRPDVGPPPLPPKLP